jgi:L-asparaginase II
MGAVELVELWRGDLLESVHRGHAVVCDAAGQVVAAWGDPGAVIFPRSSSKMIQALPLLESGAGAGLSPERLALACASHGGALMHTERVAAWLSEMGLGDGDLRCGAHMPSDRPTAEGMIRDGERPCQVHNNCSGKHTGFLALARHLRAGPEYVEIDHPVQVAARGAFEEVTGETSPGWGVDGCSAPNFACTVGGLARAMAGFARPGAGARGEAQRRLVAAMMAHPELVAGEGRACTELMRACEGRAAFKTGAEGVYVAILPEAGLGVALKIEDGATRASEAVTAAILARLGVVEAAHPVVERLTAGAQRNWRGIVTGRIVTRLGD